jgi:hypothetical protein
MKNAAELRQGTRNRLSPGRTKLMELVRSVHFGRIENLTVRCGEPVFNTGETVVREVKFGGENGMRTGDNPGVALTDKTREMFLHFDAFRNCIIRYLEVKHGKPFKMNVVAGTGETP